MYVSFNQPTRINFWFVAWCNLLYLLSIVINSSWLKNSGNPHWKLNYSFVHFDSSLSTPWFFFHPAGKLADWNGSVDNVVCESSLLCFSLTRRHPVYVHASVNVFTRSRHSFPFPHLWSCQRTNLMTSPSVLQVVQSSIHLLCRLFISLQPR